jgi:hypothetical protein
MSWRFLFAVLVVAAGASAWGGIKLGDWMVGHAPQASANATVNQGDSWSDKPVLDADGRPYVAQPPQPRVDGTLGVPEKPAAQDWSNRPPSLFDSNTAGVQISRNTVSADQAAAAAAANNAGLPAGASDIATLNLDGSQPLPPPNSPAPPPLARGDIGNPLQVAQGSYPQSAPPQAASGSWKDSLHREIEQCSNLGFFQRPTCVWNARNKYCTPNHGWGTIEDCPSRPGD